MHLTGAAGHWLAEVQGRDSRGQSQHSRGGAWEDLWAQALGFLELLLLVLLPPETLGDCCCRRRLGEAVYFQEPF